MRFGSFLCFLLLVPLPALALEGDIYDVHDPTIIEADGWFYIIYTSPHLEIRRSPDLYNWTTVGHVFDELPAWAKEKVPKAWDFWAPDLSRVGDEYRLYYCVSQFATNHSVMALATNATLDPEDPAYGWKDHGPVIESGITREDNWNAIDPNLFLGADGRQWLSFGSYWSGIQLVEIDPATGGLLGDGAAQIGLAERPEARAVEAPFILYRQGRYNLFVSFDQCCQGSESTYHLRVGQSDSIEGPYLDRSGRAMLDGGGSLLLGGYGDIHGPGHGDIINVGGTDYLVHHFYDGTREGRRCLQIRPLIWDDAGWPLPGPPLAGPVGETSAEQPSCPVGGWRHFVDFREAGELELSPDGSIGTKGRWAMDGRVLTLTWPDENAPGGVREDACIYTGDYFVGRNQDDSVVMGFRSGD